MQNVKRMLALILVFAMMFALAACSERNETDTTAANKPGEQTTTAANGETQGTDKPNTPASSEDNKPVNNTPLVVAYSPFSQKFSPFYADTAYDQDVAGMVGLGLMTTDRMGGIIYNAIEGETVNYNGTDYTYTGCADLDVAYDSDTNTTTYTAKIRDDLKFSDGEPVTAKDIIFTYYTYLDPAYVGSTSLASYDIIGLTNWRTQTSDAVYNKYSGIADTLLKDGRGEGYVANSTYTEDMYKDFWNDIDTQWAFTVQCIYDEVHGKHADDEYAPTIGKKTYEEIKANDGLMVAYAMRLWNFCKMEEVDGKKVLVDATTGTFSWDLETSFPTMDDFIAVTKAAYNDNPADFFDAEKTGNEGTSIVEFARSNLISKYGPLDSEMAGKGVNSIEGIKMVDDYTVTITVNGYSAPAVYSILGITITPMHYYGDPAKWDPDNGMYGFERGNLEQVKALTEVPRGAGPYEFVSYKDKVVTFKANPNYYKGEPKIKTIQFKETAAAEVATAVNTGDADAGEMTGSRTRFEEVANYNSNHQITGDVITTSKVDNLGYGYIGMNADTINVNGEPASDASKALRRALATVLAVYRDVAFDSYYGEAASVIQYPISNTSWAAPKPADEGYHTAYSVDVDGNPIYDASMSQEDRYAAAKEAAVGYFKAAGLPFDEATGKFTVDQTWEVMIPSQGQQDHPAYGVAVAASEVLADLGITLQVNDVGTSVWNNALESNTAMMWAAAWQSTVDPDMTQVYSSANAHGNGTNSNHYSVDDAALDELIKAGRGSADTEYRKSVYRDAMEIIMDWGCELPLYQRKDCTVASSVRVVTDTLPGDMTPYWGWYAEVETLAVQ